MHRVFSSFVGASVAALVCACQMAKPEGDKKLKAGAPVDIGFLLSMDFKEAAAISAKQIEVPPLTKVAADEIEVLKTDAQGRARKVRAKGHVFVQMSGSPPTKAFCHEALISDDDVILRGNPLLQRGQSLLEGVADVTVFYVMGARLRAIGPHKLSKPVDAMRDVPLFAAWQRGPNPLLPPLESSAVPDSIREELRKASEAEAALQKSRAGQPMAFPEAVERPVPAP